MYSHRIQTGLQALSIKYIQILPIEFVGIAVFALTSFFPNNDVVFWEGLKAAAIVSGLTATIELFHKYVMPRLNRIQLSDQAGMVTFVAAIVFFVFVWIQTFLIALEHIRS